MENTQTKPKVKLTGQDDNVFNLIGIASKALKRAGQSENANKMTKECFDSGSYHEALSIIMNYCEVN